MKIIIAGSGKVGKTLAQLLEKDGIQVTMLDKSHARCVELAGLLPQVSVICGDCSSQAVLEAQGIDHADAVIACTGIDETNMIISLYAAKCGVPQVITEVSRG